MDVAFLGSQAHAAASQGQPYVESPCACGVTQAGVNSRALYLASSGEDAGWDGASSLPRQARPCVLNAMSTPCWSQVLETLPKLWPRWLLSWQAVSSYKTNAESTSPATSRHRDINIGRISRQVIALCEESYLSGL